MVHLGYGESRVFGRGEAAASGIFDGLSIDIDAVFADEE